MAAICYADTHTYTLREIKYMTTKSSKLSYRTNQMHAHVNTIKWKAEALPHAHFKCRKRTQFNKRF